MRALAQVVSVVTTAICACLLLIGIFGHPLRDRNRLKHHVTVLQIQSFLRALEQYKRDCKDYPSNLDGLDALVANPGVPCWRGPYLSQDVPRDPWGGEYRYSYSPETQILEIKSYAADGKPGGQFFDADISSRSLNAVAPESPVEAKARRMLIGLTAGACVGLLASFVLWGLASRINGVEEP